MVFGLCRRSFYTKVRSLGKPLSILDDGSALYGFAEPTLTRGGGAPEKDSPELPPRVREYPSRSKLSESQINEMKELRLKDPHSNTVSQLCLKFNTFPGFVLKHTKISKERRAKLELQHQKEFEGLQLSKKKRIVDRIRRKELW